MYKKIILLSVFACLTGASIAASDLDEALNAAVNREKHNNICCLPVLEMLDTHSALGYCYYARNGYLSARIEDSNLRDEANQHISEYPVCKDAWCSFNRGLSKIEYYRIDQAGRVLKSKQQKFEKDVIGFLDSIPALHVYDHAGSHIWVGRPEPAACRIDVDFNMELLDPICAMKNHGNREISYLLRAEMDDVITALSNGDYESYTFFYVPFSTAEGVVKKEYLEKMMKSDYVVGLVECGYNSSSEANFKKLGFTITK